MIAGETELGPMIVAGLQTEPVRKMAAIVVALAAGALVLETAMAESGLGE